MRTGLPFVRIKMAMSLDGRTAMASGESQWITGEAARMDVQRLRARSSAILTGAGTVMQDNPSLNVRLNPGQTGSAVVRQPLRVVLDGRARLRPDMKLFKLAGQIVVFTRGRYAAELPCEVIDMAEGAEGDDASGGRLDLRAVLQQLAAREANEIHVEAGAVLSGALVGQGLVDELVIYIAPHLMGSGARGLFELPGLERMQDRIALEILDVRHVGQDLRVTAVPDTGND
jgi:diaminohydroxyphosphoribosylaminopyrimidine deaminase/5-amino-6-(5-phosphoribosylamino)uracil reductase